MKVDAKIEAMDFVHGLDKPGVSAQALQVLTKSASDCWPRLQSEGADFDKLQFSLMNGITILFQSEVP